VRVKASLCHAFAVSPTKFFAFVISLSIMSYYLGLQNFQLFIPPDLADVNSSWAATVL